jgi:uncharacterized phage-like protein YoqJ
VNLVQGRRNVTFRWIKGHSGDPMNDLVDRLAVEAATTQQGRSGVGEPDHLGPPDLPPVPPVPVDQAPPIAGHPQVVFGHRPPELGGYEDNPISRAVAARLVDIIEAKATLNEDLVVVSGLRLGAEMLAAEAALDVGVPLVAVLPYPKPETVWPAEAQARFRALVEHAIEVIELQRRVPANRQQAGAALARRDAWLARHTAEAVVVWDRQDPALGRLVRSLGDHLGETEVWVVDPGELTEVV